MKHVDSKEELAKQMQKAQESLEANIVDFKFPTILTSGRGSVYGGNRKID